MDATYAETELIETATPRIPRRFSEIHRDLWEVVRRAPGVFLLTPIALWLPANWVIEILVQGVEGDWLEQLRAYNRLGQVANAAVGTLVTSIYLAALTEMGKNRRVTVGRAFRQGFHLWADIIGIYLRIGWRVSLGLLLLIIPGVSLLLRYALAAPAAAFEDKAGVRGLEASVEYMKGNYGRVLFGVIAASLIYMPFGFGAMFLVPEVAPPWLHAVSSLPLAVLVSFITIALTLIYVDCRSDISYFRPVGTKAPEGTDGTSELPPGSGRRQVVATVLATVVCAALTVLLWNWYALKPIDDGDEAWKREAYGESLEHYRKAARWNPEAGYVQYSIGWCLYMLEQTSEAETYFERAIELEPDNSAYLVDHARVLIDLGITSKARARLAAAREKGYANVELLDELEAQLELGQGESPPPPQVTSDTTL